MNNQSPSKPLTPKTKQQQELIALLRRMGNKGVVARNGVYYVFGSITKLVSKLTLDHRFNISKHRIKYANDDGTITWTVRYVLHPGVYREEHR